MDFRWKEKESITLFNEELAEFDVVKHEVETKKANYVSGLAGFFASLLKENSRRCLDLRLSICCRG